MDFLCFFMLKKSDNPWSKLPKQKLYTFRKYNSYQKNIIFKTLHVYYCTMCLMYKDVIKEDYSY